MSMLKFMCACKFDRYIHLRLWMPFGKVCLPFFEFGLPFPWKWSIEGDSKSWFRFLEWHKSWRRKPHVKFLFEDRLPEEIQEQRHLQCKLNRQSSCWTERSNGECSVSKVRMQCFKMANASVSEMHDFTPTDACDFYCVTGRRLFTRTHCSTTIIIFFFFFILNGTFSKNTYSFFSFWSLFCLDFHFPCVKNAIQMLLGTSRCAHHPTSHSPSCSSASVHSRRVSDPYVLLATPLGLLSCMRMWGRVSAMSTTSQLSRSRCALLVGKLHSG